MKRVLVTGGTGFVGANLCRRLLEEGHEVVCLVRPNHKRWRIAGIEEHLHIKVTDLADAASLEMIVREARPDWVFHLAPYGAYSWQTDPQQIVATNLLGTVNLLQACLRRGFEIFINTGSSSEYGFKDHAPAEDEPIEPNSHYAVAKAGATLYCQSAARAFGLCAVTLRLYSVYGPFEEPNRLIPNVIIHGLKGELPHLVDPAIGRDFIYVRDVEDAYLHLAANPGGIGGEIFNLGSGVQSSIADVVRLAQSTFGIHETPRWNSMPKRLWDTTVWRADNRKLAAAGWKPRITLEEGFRKTISWFEAHPEFKPIYTGDIDTKQSA